MSAAFGRSRPFTYRDAVALLDGEQSGFVSAVDGAGGAVAGATHAVTLGGLDLFAVRDEVVRWSGEVVGSIGERLSGLSRVGRTDRIAAAHAIIVITAFYEAFDSGDAPMNLADLELSREEQVALSTGGALAQSYGALVTQLAHRPPPMPTPQRPYEETRTELVSFYTYTMYRVRGFAAGLRVWEELEPARRDDLVADCEPCVRRALRNYDELFRRLAADVPEFALWAGQVDSGATRAAARREADDLRERLATLETGLEGTAGLLARMSTGARADERRAQLATRYRRDLDRPIVRVSGSVDGVRLPTLGAAYVNPSCRVAETDHGSSPAVESWWEGQARVEDTQAFLVGHLTSPQASRAPLMVLGQPGSGKSLLTKVLAARLPENDFLPVRVELRAVPADATVQEQVERAVLAETGERVDWADLSRSAGDALPVVLLDGFDELLQATQVNRSDFLARVAEFQEREADLDRPVAVVVTSRTAVADRVRYPEGVVVARLEPFTEGQVRGWLGVWNATNRAEFRRREIVPLSAGDVLAHKELAEQPLLLLMLALYDAEANALRDAGPELSRAELYERIIWDFAIREVGKERPDLPEREAHRAATAEMERLSLVALAMFVRRHQSISEAALDRDLEKLAPGARRAVGEDFHRPLTAAQLLVGRFFFVHESRALRDTERERSFEFLHATFGEFLVAWRVVRELGRVARTREVLVEQGLAGHPDDHRFLFDMLSFVPLTRRQAVPEFAEQLLRALPERDREKYWTLLAMLIASSLDEVPDRAAYAPVSLRVTERLAAYSANLVILAVFAADGKVTADKLFGNPTDWRSFSHLWESQLSDMENAIMGSLVRVRHESDATTIQREDGSPVSFRNSVWEWTDHVPATGDGEVLDDWTVPAEDGVGQDLREVAYLPSFLASLSAMALEPVYRHAEGYVGRFRISDDRAFGPTQVLLDLALTRVDPDDYERRVRQYHWCFREVARITGPHGVVRAFYTQLAKDAAVLPADAVITLLHQGEVLLRVLEFADGVLDVVDVLNHRFGEDFLPKVYDGFGPLGRSALWFVITERDYPLVSMDSADLKTDTYSLGHLAAYYPERVAEMRRRLAGRGEADPFAELDDK